MKKPLLFFIIAVILFIIAKIAYDKYCESKPDGCKNNKPDEREEFPVKGVDW